MQTRPPPGKAGSGSPTQLRCARAGLMQTRPPPGKAGSGPPTQLRCARAGLMQTRPPPGKAGSGPPTQLRCARKPASRLTWGQRDAGWIRAAAMESRGPQ